jgi:methylenetetrahydrofolate reductase (NADPH)
VIDVFRKLWPFGSSQRDTESSPAMRELARNLHFELVPMKSIEDAMAALPPKADVSLTCSPVKGIIATQEYTERLLALGHRPTPHIAARLVESPVHAKQIASWLREQHLSEVFVIAGDATEPAGPYEGSLPFMRDLLDADPGVKRVGFAGYPDGHAFIDAAELVEQVHAKQSLLAEAGVDGWISTQMCFDADRIREWLTGQRAAGLNLPIRLGIPGVVDRTRLMTMGARLGVGTSLRFLSKNRSTVMKLMAPGGYDPTDLVVALADDATALGIEALHSFTFNAVADTRKWQEAMIAS